ncbi:MAG: winged helix-turn-helix transcriptional regulator [Hyphomonadaceae bacterium]
MTATPTDPTAEDTRCPLTAALNAIGGKWAMIALYWLAAAPRRFGELQRLMPEISHKVLAETLRSLEGEGLVRRVVISEMPAHVEYELSSHGQSALEIVEAMRTWGRSHLEHKNS